jgi:CheY-like chemotaxis protein
MCKWNVLVIENQTISTENLRQVHDYDDIEISLAHTAEEGLRHLASNSPNAVVIDLALQGVNGWEMLAQMRNQYPTAGIPAIALTALPSFSLAEEAIDAGFSTCIEKPIEASMLVQELERLLKSAA